MPTSTDKTCRIRLDLTPAEQSAFRVAAAKAGFQHVRLCPTPRHLHHFHRSQENREKRGTALLTLSPLSTMMTSVTDTTLEPEP